MQNLLPGPEPTLLPAETDAADLLAKADSEGAVKAVAAQFPSYSAAWARLAELALSAGEPVTAYAYARTGYHRGLDQLRRNGWRGVGPVPWAHEPNQGFLRALHALGLAAGQIGETEEAERCATFLRDSDPAAVSALS
ncbi:DUF3151 domain-containing protein [Dactylosporangium sp. NPDC051541]|uniref:DUF3151 domain-containing protein n=1 Tax=Dactylosporangium sp. NPDC051541 TaxID=3363977 RepID=UPI00379C16F5